MHISKKTFFLLTGMAAIALYYFVFKRPVVIDVETVRVERGEVQATVSNTRVGTVKACRRAYLAPATGGQVAKLHVKEGDKVKQHQLLMEVWNDDLKAQLKLQDAQVRANQASAEQSCQLGAGAARDARRFEKLQQYKRHIVSEQQVDSKKTDARAQRAGCRAALEAVAVSQANLEVVDASIARTQLLAPFDGTVAEINVELGEYVTPSPPGIPTLPAIDLLDVSCLYVSAPIDEVDAPQIKTGMSACVTLDAFSDKRCSATVSRIAPYVLEKEKQARTVEVEVKLSDSDLKDLLPGYSADIEVLLESKQQVLQVPTEAVLENHRVLWVNADNILEERTFTPGLANWNTVEVLSGLSEGDRIVSSIGKDGVVAGAHVRIIQ